MLKLLKNLEIFRDGTWKNSDLLIADGKIALVGDSLRVSVPGLERTDCRGAKAIPGYIDQHVHITGGGGEGSFITQVPPMKLSDPVRGGVTTLVGLLGTDGTTRSVRNLVAKTKALKEYGLTAFCLTGNYNYPSPTLTGSVMDDIVFIEEIIGVKIAICDHRSANMTVESLIKLASDARVAGMLSGKPGIVHLHTGSGREKLRIVFEALEKSEVPIWNFRPTHMAPKYEDAKRFSRMGGFVDFTCDPSNMEKRSALLCRALEELPAGKMTVSTDSNGSLPVWNERKELVGMGAGRISALHETVRAMVLLHGCPLEKAIVPVTENPARALNLYPRKGCLLPGSDADIVLLDADLNVRTVYANGKCMMKEGVLEAVPYFEQ